MVSDGCHAVIRVGEFSARLLPLANVRHVGLPGRERLGLWLRVDFLPHSWIGRNSCKSGPCFYEGSISGRAISSSSSASVGTSTCSRHRLKEIGNGRSSRATPSPTAAAYFGRERETVFKNMPDARGFLRPMRESVQNSLDRRTPKWLNWPLRGRIFGGRQIPLPPIHAARLFRV